LASGRDSLVYAIKSFKVKKILVTGGAGFVGVQTNVSIRQFIQKKILLSPS